MGREQVDGQLRRLPDSLDGVRSKPTSEVRVRTGLDFIPERHGGEMGREERRRWWSIQGDEFGPGRLTERASPRARLPSSPVCPKA